MTGLKQRNKVTDQQREDNGGVSSSVRTPGVNAKVKAKVDEDDTEGGSEEEEEGDDNDDEEEEDDDDGDDGTPPNTIEPTTPTKSKKKLHHVFTKGLVRAQSLTKKSKSKSAAKYKEGKTENSRRFYQTRRVVFVLGAVIGLALTIIFSLDALLPEFAPLFVSELDKYINIDSVNDFLEDWKDVIPTSIQGIIGDMGIEHETEDAIHGSAELFSVGRRMAKQYNVTRKFNVLLVPGTTSTGIESWGLDNTDISCPSQPHFRKRLWGSYYMLKTMIMDKSCWLKHIMLDPVTGLDPPGIKLRACQGFEGADFFMAGYWIWNKVLQNLAVIGYDPNTMLSASYDWRLAFLDLERRDAYFSKLKESIELNKRQTGEKTVLVGHSMGAQVIYYFMKWVEAEGPLYGNGGSQWVNDHIEAFVDVSGTLLGAPKCVPALISGEMKDTVQLNAIAMYGLEKFFSRKERVQLLRSFGGIPSMLPKGGDLIWGTLTEAPDDVLGLLNTSIASEEAKTMKAKSYGTFIELVNKTDSSLSRNLTVADSLEYLLDTSPEWFVNRINEQYSYGVAKTRKELEENNKHHSKWSNPLEAALPYAPDMKIYCFYGVGNPTERAYKYADAGGLTDLDITIDPDSPDRVTMGDGDGTVSLLAHSICHEWQKGSALRYNPGNSKVTIVEMKHEPDRFDIRGGAKTAEHVDILGSAELNELILKVAGGLGDTIQNRFISNLGEIVETLDI
ncbi:uncharacterized protein KQ657_002100 [Scheffersomyces spartinae]|uniref:Phospholipid:diacylglycerol acyltransferase n=1 Tax=Scheffersomyces spartinae TaxID=45513 RepID=A0A9P7VDI6_9ASCO|nr:uncharacterized protein KQ657_002100 [Scheffersomyces spartinae]KAG7195717.1 hypothetical protein KQ657_002100 [Scheffersomyces spartinae]